MLQTAFHDSCVYVVYRWCIYHTILNGCQLFIMHPRSIMKALYNFMRGDEIKTGPFEVGMMLVDLAFMVVFQSCVLGHGWCHRSRFCYVLLFGMRVFIDGVSRNFNAVSRTSNASLKTIK